MLIASQIETTELSLLKRRALSISAGLWLFEWLILLVVLFFVLEQPLTWQVTVWRIFWFVSALGIGMLAWRITYPFRLEPFIVVAAIGLTSLLVLGL
ncbi:MAG: hypothetical protein AAF978_10675, partial [Cyanobacteria bacterium P01_E01_bin.48]